VNDGPDSVISAVILKAVSVVDIDSVKDGPSSVIAADIPELASKNAPMKPPLLPAVAN